MGLCRPNERVPLRARLRQNVSRVLSYYSSGPRYGSPEAIALDVLRTTTTAENERAYREVTKIHHPNGAGSAVMFRRVSEARRVLGDPVRRANHTTRRRHGTFAPIPQPQTHEWTHKRDSWVHGRRRAKFAKDDHR